MDTGLISRRYAKALAEYSASLGEEARVYEQLRPFSRQFDFLPQVREAVLSPSLSEEEKAAVIASYQGGAADHSRSPREGRGGYHPLEGEGP